MKTNKKLPKKGWLDEIDEIRNMSDDPKMAKEASKMASGGVAHKNYIKDVWGEMPKESPSKARQAARRAALLANRAKGGLLKRSLKMLPLVGTALGAYNALKSGDIMAATGFGDSTSTGPIEGTSEYDLENGNISNEERNRLGLEAKRRAIEEFRKGGYLVNP